MKAKLKKYITSSFIAVALLSGSLTTAHADTYKVVLSNVWAYEDADYRPGPAGDVRLSIEIDGEIMFTNLGKPSMQLNDKDKNKYYFKNKGFGIKSNKKVKKVEGDFTLDISAWEYDGGTANERCEATKSHNSRNTGKTKLKCPGSLGLWLTYYVKKIN